MAIDDDKNYTLTGAQIKDLVAQVKAAQPTIRKLVVADKNWNTSTGAQGTPNVVAAWLLPTGIYETSVTTLITNDPNNYTENGILIVQEEQPNLPGRYACLTWYNNRNMNQLFMAQVKPDGTYNQSKVSVTFS